MQFTLQFFSLFDPANKVTQNNDSTDNSVSPVSRVRSRVFRDVHLSLVAVSRKVYAKEFTLFETFNFLSSFF